MLVVAGVVLVLGLLISAISCNRNVQSETIGEKIVNEQSLIKTEVDGNKESDIAKETKPVTDKKQSAPAQIDKAKQLQIEEDKKAITTKNDGFESKHPTKNTTTATTSQPNAGKPSIKSKINNNADGSTIFIGKGGGITGAVTEYQILSNGTVLKKNGFTAALTEIKKLSGEDIAVVTQKFNDLNLSSVNYNKPGNLYYFLGTQKGLNMHRVTWSGQDENLPKNVQEFYQFVMQNVIK